MYNRINAGEIYIEDKNVLRLKTSELNQVRKHIGFLFQSGALYDSMSVRENLAFPLIRNFDFTLKEIEAKVINALKMVSLEDPAV